MHVLASVTRYNYATEIELMLMYHKERIPAAYKWHWHHEMLLFVHKHFPRCHHNKLQHVHNCCAFRRQSTEPLHQHKELLTEMINCVFWGKVINLFMNLPRHNTPESYECEQ